MLTITEKDGATIITIENPSASEQDIIKKAKNAQRVSAWVNGASKAQPAKASTPSTTSAPAAEKPSSWKAETNKCGFRLEASCTKPCEKQSAYGTAAFRTWKPWGF